MPLNKNQINIPDLSDLWIRVECFFDKYDVRVVFVPANQTQAIFVLRDRYAGGGGVAMTLHYTRSPSQ